MLTANTTRIIKSMYASNLAVWVDMSEYNEMIAMVRVKNEKKGANLYYGRCSN